MPRSDLLLRLLALAIAVTLFLVVRGERRVSATFTVPVAVKLPPALAAPAPPPDEVSVSVSGPWSRLRALEGSDLGPVVVDLTRAGPGATAWIIRPEALHPPRGVRIDSIYPAQGVVELRRGP